MTEPVFEYGDRSREDESRDSPEDGGRIAQVVLARRLRAGQLSRTAGHVGGIQRGAAEVMIGLTMVVGFSVVAAGCGNSERIGSDAQSCSLIASPEPAFCPNGRVEQVDDEDGCPIFTCVPNECPLYQKPECPQGQHVETVTDTAGCNVPRCTPDVCPQAAAPRADFCPEGERIESYVNAAGCPDFRCVPANCPLYQKPLCPKGQHVETVVNDQGCNEPVCVADVDPCATLAAPDAATFCPGGQIMLDEALCQWVCHGGDRCPSLGVFNQCLGTTVIESDSVTHCLTDLHCLP